MACRINYTSAWKLRLLYELSNWDKAMFVTLTYDELHVPEDFSLHKKDIVGFFKRLRAYLDYADGDRRIKYYACGEYGQKLDPTRPDKKHGRPHFHAIIFGLCPYDDKDRQFIVDAWQHRSEDWQFDRNRGKKSAIQNVTPEDIEYVTGYVQKKLSGSLAGTTYNGDTPPFAIMSKGLGKDFALQNADRLRMNGFTYLNGHKISLPRYFRDKLDIEVDYTNIKVDVEKFMKHQEYLNSQFDEYLKSNNIQVHHNSVQDLNNNSRLFEKFYESRKWEIANQVFKDFEQRQKMRNGL